MARCRVLAHAVRAHAPVTFWLDEEGERWAPLLRQEGFDVGGWKAGQEQFAACLVDGRGFAPGHMSMLEECARLVIAFDDHDVPLERCNVVISPWGKTAPQAHGKPVLAGLDYALVDPRFATLPAHNPPPLPDKLLLAFGYRDSPNATGRVVASVKRLRVNGWQPRLVAALGAGAPNQAAVTAALSDFGHGAQLVEDTKDMVPLIGDCDLVIGAGGTSALERAAAGRPSISIALNDLQGGLIAALADAGGTVNAGLLASITDAELDGIIWRVALDQALRRSLADRARRAVDGLGTTRLASALLSFTGQTSSHTHRLSGAG